MKLCNAIIDWLGKDPVFPWFAGSGLAFVLCCVTVAFVVALIANKKLRNKFF
jgi:hypothetical protein